MKKKKTRNKNKKIRVGLVLIIFAFILFSRNIYIKYVKGNTLLIVDTKKYEKIINSNALMIRDEYVYSYDENINLDSITDKKIGVNNILGSINNYSNRYGLDTNININDMIIEKPFNDEDKNIELISSANIIDSIQNRNYGDISKIGISVISEDSKNFEIEQFNILKYVTESNGKKLKSLNSGVISTKVDGYENIYNIHQTELDLTNLNLENINLYNVNKNNGFKIMNNNYYGMIIPVNKNDLSVNYGIGDNIIIRMNDVELIGIVYDLKNDNEKLLIAALFDIGFDLFQENRFYNIDIINYSTYSCEILEKSLIKENGQLGVYIKNTRGIIEFKPVELISKDGKVALVSYGDNGIIKVNNKEVETIHILDEIIKNPSKVRIGEIVG